MKITDAEVNAILEKFDLTDPAMQRRIVVQFASLNINLSKALEESVSLQSHYATLLNAQDDGGRLTFASAQEWLDRLIETKTIAPGTKVS